MRATGIFGSLDQVGKDLHGTTRNWNLDVCYSRSSAEEKGIMSMQCSLLCLIFLSAMELYERRR